MLRSGVRFWARAPECFVVAKRVVGKCGVVLIVGGFNGIVGLQFVECFRKK